jgi:hypothetical protein
MHIIGLDDVGGIEHAMAGCQDYKPAAQIIGTIAQAAYPGGI